MTSRDREIHIRIGDRKTVTEKTNIMKKYITSVL